MRFTIVFEDEEDGGVDVSLHTDRSFPSSGQSAAGDMAIAVSELIEQIGKGGISKNG